MEHSDPRIVRRAHQDYYGFEVSDKYISDLAAYVKNPARTPSMLASGDAQTVREAIQQVYGFWVTVDYANDLLAFSQRHTKED